MTATIKLTIASDGERCGECPSKTRHNPHDDGFPYYRCTIFNMLRYPRAPVDLRVTSGIVDNRYVFNVYRCQACLDAEVKDD